MRDEMPQEIQSLIAQCEVGVESFDNDQMSAALFWGEQMFHALDELLERCEQFSVQGVYFDEPCMTANVQAIAKARRAMMETSRNGD